MSNFAKYENLQALFTAIGKKKLSVSDTMPTAGATYEDICILYIGPTDANYTKGYVYECEEVTPSTDPKTYSWNAKINVDVDLSKYKTIFPGTKDEWDALTQAQQDQYDYCFFDDDESDYYSVVDSITEGDMHPVTSNAVYERTEETEDEISDIVNYYGAKNIVPFDLNNIIAINTEGTWNGNVYTRNGVTWTVNEDGTVNASGTVTEGENASSIKLFLSNSSLPFIGKTLKMSGCPDGGRSDNTTYYKMMLYRITTTDGSSGTVEAYNSNDTDSFVWRNDGSGTKGYLSLSVYAAAGTVDLLFKPMLRLASIKDDTYDPYVMTNKELETFTKTIKSQTDENKDAIKDIVNVYGSKNLLPIGSREIKGTSTNWESYFTENADGTFTIKGSTTSRVSVSRKAILPAGQYYMNGCPSGGGSSNYRLMFLTYDSGSEAVVYEDRGNSASIVTLATETTVYARCDVYANASGVTGKIFKPMIRKASITNSEYVPYAKTNKQLTDDSVDWDNLSEFGAVNLLDNILATTTKNGLTATVNSDKSVTVTADSYPFTVSTATYFALQTVTPTGVHKLSGCPNTGDSKIHIYVRNNSGGYIYDYGDGGIGSFGSTGCNITFLSGAVVTEELTFYPMVTDPSYNGPYVPYAKTNKQLTEDTETINITDSVTTTVGTLSVTKGYRVGKIVFVEGNITLTSDVAAWDKILTVDIDRKFANQYIFTVGYDYNNSTFVPLQLGYDNENLKLETIKALTSGILLKFAFNAVLE